MLMHRGVALEQNTVEISHHYAGTQLFANGLVTRVIRLGVSGNSRRLGMGRTNFDTPNEVATI
jgi:hypothetical protein